MKIIYGLLAMSLMAIVIHSNSVFAGDKDNGGSLTLMQKARSLSEDELTGYLSTNSLGLRNILEGLVLYIDGPSINAEDIRAMVTSMKTHPTVELLDDVRYSNYNSNLDAFRSACGDSADRDLCTENDRPLSTIYFNIPKLVEKKVSLAELVGLIMHEHSRHFVGNADANHHLANFYMEAFLRNAQVGKVFTITDGLSYAPYTFEGEFNRKFIFGFYRGTKTEANQIEFAKGEDLKSNADALCRSKGMMRAVNFESTATAPAGFDGYWSFPDDDSRTMPIRFYTSPDLVWAYFSKIICSAN